MINIYDLPHGRLGNAIFRYLSSTIFILIYGGNRDFTQYTDFYHRITDEFYLDWKNKLLYNNYLIHVENNNYVFDGYFQHDDILQKYKYQLIEYIKKNPTHLLITHDNVKYNTINLITPINSFNKYNIVFHLRLEDFIQYNLVMNPKNLIEILDNYKNEQICFVVNQITTEIEKKYIEFFTKKYNIIIESNDVITDFHIMKNAKILCCSCSTLSWCAAFFSETVELVYFPNYDMVRLHETFKKPIENTILYETSRCSIEELTSIIDS
jgi:hypothetical protein